MLFVVLFPISLGGSGGANESLAVEFDPPSDSSLSLELVRSGGAFLRIRPILTPTRLTSCFALLGRNGEYAVHSNLRFRLLQCNCLSGWHLPMSEVFADAGEYILNVHVWAESPPTDALLDMMKMHKREEEGATFEARYPSCRGACRTDSRTICSRNRF